MLENGWLMRVSLAVVAVLGTCSARAAEERRELPPMRSVTPNSPSVGALVAFSHDGKLLAASVRDREIVLWELEGQREITRLLRHKDRIRCLAFSPDDHMLASSDESGLAYLWARGDTWQTAEATALPRPQVEETSKRSRSNKSTMGFDHLAFSPDGKMLVADYRAGRTLRVLRVEGLEPIAELEPEGACNSLSFFPRGNLLVAGEAMDPRRKGGSEIQFWDMAKFTKQSSLSMERPGPVVAALSPDGKYLAAAVSRSGDYVVEIRVWELSTRRSMMLACDRMLMPFMAFSPDSRLLAVGMKLAPAQVVLWDVASGKPTRTLKHPSGDWVWSVAFSKDGSLLATGICHSDDPVWLWRLTDSPSREEPRVLQQGGKRESGPTLRRPAAK